MYGMLCRNGILFGFGKICHKVRDFSNIKCKEKAGGKARILNETLQKNTFYALHSRDE